MKVIVASTNPVKIEVAKQAFEQVFPNERIEVMGAKSHSGVPDQPFDDETLLGAENRLKDIQTTYPDADYWIAQEGGLHNEGSSFYNRAWIIISDKDGAKSKASTANFYIPKTIAEYVRQGDELSVASDKFFNTENSKQKSGGIAFLTDGLINRTSYYVQAAIIALSQLKHKDWYI
ncbi:MAG: inosine/xanthosine triphosphatase [Candidatus Magasanikbacteria bacterium]|nr:inosine/xanthosine triphosphatase [Candidatus Magasanikbacteria bacterium]